MADTSDRFIAYPDRAVVAVIDDHAGAEAAIRDLRGAGFDANAITLLQGPEGADRIDGMGRAHGVGSDAEYRTAPYASSLAPAAA